MKTKSEFLRIKKQYFKQINSFANAFNKAMVDYKRFENEMVNQELEQQRTISRLNEVEKKMEVLSSAKSYETDYGQLKNRIMSRIKELAKEANQMKLVYLN